MIDSSVGWEMAGPELRLVRREGGAMPSLRIELCEMFERRVEDVSPNLPDDPWGMIGNEKKVILLAISYNR